MDSLIHVLGKVENRLFAWAPVALGSRVLAPASLISRGGPSSATVTRVVTPSLGASVSTVSRTFSLNRIEHLIETIKIASKIIGI